MENTSSPNPKTENAYTYVDTPERLDHLIENLKSTRRVGFDTEADSLHHYYEKVCLIQLSFSGNHYIVDPLAGVSLTPFLEALSEKEIIVQGADYDLRMLKKSFGFQPQSPVFDTMLAAQVLGYEKIGLSALVEKFFGVLLPKTGQKSDWSRRPLSSSQLQYASDDTKYLEPLAEIMQAELARLNRTTWHQECCARVVRNAALPDKNEGKETWRVKGASKMTSRELAFLRELWKWREEEAQQKDRPSFMILINEDLVTLALWGASHPQQSLSQGPSFMKRISGSRLVRLEAAFQRAANLPQAQWPELPKKTEWVQERPSLEGLDLLLGECKKIAETLKIEASFLASRAALTLIVQARPQSIEEVMKVSSLTRWQAELILPILKK